MTASGHHRGSDASRHGGDRPRPNWHLPTGLNTTLVVAPFLLGVIGLIVSTVADVPSALLAAMWLLALVPTLAAVWWSLTNVVEEIAVVTHRYRAFQCALQQVDLLCAQEEEQTQEIQRLNLLIAAIQLPENAVEIIDYLIIDALLFAQELVVTLDETDKPPLKPGAILRIIDREDGMPLGTLVVTEDRSGSGLWIAGFRDWDALFLTSLRDTAERREPVRPRFIARHEGRSEP